jgi:hypothetical protein
MYQELYWGHWALDPNTLEGLAERERLGLSTQGPDPATVPLTFGEHSRMSRTEPEIHSFDEFRFHARVLRDATRAWQVLQGEMPEDWAALPGRLTFEEALGQLEIPQGRWISVGWVQTPDDLARLVCSVIDIGLRLFHPRVTFAQGEGGHVPAWEAFDVGLFEALCLQLRNHIDEGARLRRCKSCGKLFVRQVGRQRRGLRARGVLNYCSDECANRQNVRNYRERKRREVES